MQTKITFYKGNKIANKYEVPVVDIVKSFIDSYAEGRYEAGASLEQAIVAHIYYNDYGTHDKIDDKTWNTIETLYKELKPDENS